MQEIRFENMQWSELKVKLSCDVRLLQMETLFKMLELNLVLGIIMEQQGGPRAKSWISNSKEAWEFINNE